MSEPTPRLPFPQAPLSAPDLAASVFARMRTRAKNVSLSDVSAIVEKLDLSDTDLAPRAPRLRVAWLSLAGTKRLNGKPEASIGYHQRFYPGVNVVLVPDNDVGKSSILKSIKFALTGDNGDYDADVREWISDVRLGFSLDSALFTVHVSNQDGVLRGILVPGEHFTTDIEALAADPARLFYAKTVPAVRESLERFFFDRMGLPKLSWMQQSAQDASLTREVTAGWLTYFQPIVIPDGGDEYLLCDQRHAMGNQEGLIFSAYLGLRLAGPLNRLGVDISRSKREVKAPAEDGKAAQAEAEKLRAEVRALDSSLMELDAVQQSRRSAFEKGNAAQQVATVSNELIDLAARQRALELQRDHLSAQARDARARARRLQESVELRLHFSGIEVSLCPNCEHEIPDSKVQEERTTHCCRLCGVRASPAEPDAIARLSSDADVARTSAERLTRERDEVTQQISAVKGLTAKASQREAELRRVATEGISSVLPTPEEDRQRTTLLEKRGSLKAAILAAERHVAASNTAEEKLDLQQVVLERVREALREVAAERNEKMLSALSDLTQRIAGEIGAESISDVVCSPLGALHLQKHGQRVSFRSIRNQGERMRVKLAFFLSLMSLSRTAGFGRHPGFLMIDQPGSSEMVPDDFAALTRVLRDIDERQSEDLQIICFSARPELGAATGSEKVHGPQAGQYVF